MEYKLEKVDQVVEVKKRRKETERMRIEGVGVEEARQSTTQRIIIIIITA